MKRIQAIEAFARVVERQLETARKAFEASHSNITSAESKQEGKYDTRGLEESYLANGLAQKLSDVEEVVAFLETASLQEAGDVVHVGSLVKGRQNNELVYYFVAPTGGGIEANVSGDEVVMVTPESPLGSQLLDKKAGESTVAPQLYIQEVF